MRILDGQARAESHTAAPLGLTPAQSVGCHHRQAWSFGRAGAKGQRYGFLPRVAHRPDPYRRYCDPAHYSGTAYCWASDSIKSIGKSSNLTPGLASWKARKICEPSARSPLVSRNSPFRCSLTEASRDRDTLDSGFSFASALPDIIPDKKRSLRFQSRCLKDFIHPRLPSVSPSGGIYSAPNGARYPRRSTLSKKSA